MKKNCQKSLIKERLDVASRSDEDVRISRGLFEDLVSVIGNIPLGDVQRMKDVDKENILLRATEKVRG